MFLRCKNCDYRSPEQLMLFGLCYECAERELSSEQEAIMDQVGRFVSGRIIWSEQEAYGSPDADPRTGIAYGDLT